MGLIRVCIFLGLLNFNKQGWEVRLWRYIPRNAPPKRTIIFVFLLEERGAKHTLNHTLKQPLKPTSRFGNAKKDTPICPALDHDWKTCKLSLHHGMLNKRRLSLIGCHPKLALRSQYIFFFQIWGFQGTILDVLIVTITYCNIWCHVISFILRSYYVRPLYVFPGCSTSALFIVMTTLF